jgi:biopolymer transport protein ExbD
MSMGDSGIEKRSSTTAQPYINVTPLIDVLLVLLIIFMVVTPLKPSRFKADIPTQRDPNEDLSKLKPNPLTLVVTIAPDLSIKLNQDALGSVNETAPLAQKLAQTFQQRKETRAYKVGFEARRRSHREDCLRQSAAGDEVRRRRESNRRYQRRRRESSRFAGGRSSLVTMRLAEH